MRDYIDVTDLIDAHVKALAHAVPTKVGIYNVGTGKGQSFHLYLKLRRNIQKSLKGFYYTGIALN